MKEMEESVLTCSWIFKENICEECKCKINHEIEIEKQWVIQEEIAKEDNDQI